jgi:hypothetical protein
MLAIKWYGLALRRHLIARFTVDKVSTRIVKKAIAVATKVPIGSVITIKDSSQASRDGAMSMVLRVITPRMATTVKHDCSSLDGSHDFRRIR